MPNPIPSRGRKLPRSFYRRPAEELAEVLLGKIIVRRLDGIEYRAQIIETEAYVGEHDIACHASKGRTARTEIMFGRPGFAYVYLIYGMYDMFNIVAASVGDAQAVLIRGAVPLDGLRVDLSGPGKLARGLKIRRQDNGIDLTGSSLFLVDAGLPPPRVLRTPRIGIDYAGDWKHALLRFVDADKIRLPRTKDRS